MPPALECLSSTITGAVWLVLTLGRVRFEEAALRRAFPEYERYRERVGMLGPRRL